MTSRVALRHALKRLLCVSSILLQGLATGRLHSPNVSVNFDVENEHYRELPLAVLRVTPANGGGAPPVSDLAVFAEDPNWACKVERFMVQAGADRHGVENALDQVRHVSWESGRTLLGKYLVLLAFAEDALDVGNEGAHPSRLTRAVLAASTHTAEAHFLLVADGFELDAMTREATILRQGKGGDGFRQLEYSRDPPAPDEVVIDKRNQISPEALEALVQADSDLFFLPLLLEAPSPEHDDADSVRRCMIFHSEWMERTPDKVLEDNVLDRRKRFPVAVVVVIHDENSLVRAALDEVAIVVEHILILVSLQSWHGAGKDTSPTLELLNDMLEDADSPSFGKLQVEVGSWATEREQRQHGDSLIKKDPRDFFRVVVMNGDEFWHPVELAKALVLAAKHPEARCSVAEVDIYWASVRSLVVPANMHMVWLKDPHRCEWSMIEGHRLAQVQMNKRFVDAVANGDSEAARYLSTYYTVIEVPKLASDGYENAPTLVGMADVFVNNLGYVWNEKDYIVPKSCEANLLGPRGRTALPTSAESYDKVFVITQRWGNEYFHFLVENLPRITPMLDILRENLDIKALYPTTGGIPVPVARPVIVLIVREHKRGLKNNDKVREALKEEFPTFDIVEFLGIGSIMSQLKLFATASLIVAPHGAGLSNMVVSSLHTPVLEIGPPICAACFMHLAVKLQHIYARHPGSSEWDTPCDGKYEPDVGEILLLVRDLLEGQRQADSVDSPKVFGGHL
ncbi:conserved unknown protein [Ectocarpus siliculosus]|uniref:Glycosyltransferase 61 catalytic domain-containing protein n=1 Tax=Ectocarpus siliculosus TaxID=2880 RepID=D7FK27_ECTSI|nr:conserved unknown protein [Ectocarpus siliculosus]|eukprot:CBJ29237.1 conserved unknown protein [Ectocarpus siliculosus]